MAYFLKIYENFFSFHSFPPELAFGETKAGLASRTPKVHPNDELCVRFRTNIRKCVGGFYFIFLVNSNDNRKS